LEIWPKILGMHFLRRSLLRLLRVRVCTRERALKDRSPAADVTAQENTRAATRLIAIGAVSVMISHHTWGRRKDVLLATVSGDRHGAADLQTLTI
jgi:hypothetical protein